MLMKMSTFCMHQHNAPTVAEGDYAEDDFVEGKCKM